MLDTEGLLRRTHTDRQEYAEQHLGRDSSNSQSTNNKLTTSTDELEISLIIIPFPTELAENIKRNAFTPPK